MILKNIFLCCGRQGIPRAGGDDPNTFRRSGMCYDVFPAQAGMILAPLFLILVAKGIPRAGGDDPDDFIYNIMKKLYSPRRRG